MKRASRFNFLGLCALAIACSTNNSSTPTPPSVNTTTSNVPGRVTREDTVHVSAVVEKIDYATRQVTLRGSNREKIEFVAGPDVRNLAQVKVGDVVDAAFLRSVAITLRKPGEATPSVSAAGATQRAELGQMPGAAGAQSISIVATIRALDPANRTATLEGPDGELTTINVRNPAHFDVAKVGDLVEITYTEAVAISVDRLSR